MKIYTFEDKTFQERIDEFNLVLDNASEGESIRNQWKDFLSVTIEPAHYKAIWRVSKGICETYGIKFPAEVYGTVQQTDFDDLLAEFKVEKVQDEQIQLPEICQAPLDELFPTVLQEHSTLNIDTTANYLDSFRFFFNYIFLPFDTDEDFAIKNLIPRVKLFYDLKNKQLSKAMSSYIRHIIAEVKQIQFKRDLLNSSIEEYAEMDSDVDEDGKNIKRESKETIAQLLDLHLRMNKIKQEFEILINPEMRDAYELIKFGRKKEESKQIYLLATNKTINEQVKLLEKLKERVSADTPINWAKSLSDAISCSTVESEIFLPNGNFTFNFLDYVNGNILVCGISQSPLNLMIIEKKDGNFASISAKEDSSFLFATDGDVRFENLLIDCSLVKTGFLIKSGRIVLRNCLILGSKQSSIAEAFNISGESNLFLYNCIISNFCTGINVNDDSNIELNDCKIEKCSIGVSIVGDAAKVSVKNSSILDVDEGAIIKYSEKIMSGVKVFTESDKTDQEDFGVSISDNSNATVKIISKLLGESVEINMSDEEADVSMDNL